MLIRVILDLLFSLLGRLLVFPAQLNGVILEATSWFLWGNHYLPLDSFITCVLIVIGFWTVCAGVRIVIEVL